MTRALGSTYREIEDRQASFDLTVVVAATKSNNNHNLGEKTMSQVATTVKSKVKYNVEDILTRYTKENGRMYAGAYEWMIAEIKRLNMPTYGAKPSPESAARKALRNPNSSKRAKTAAGLALSQPFRKDK